MTLLALIQARDEERALPGWLANVADWVDGIVALDDGSKDGTREILAAHPKVIEILRRPVGLPWDERANQISLVEAARRHRGSWFLCLDADERLERSFGPSTRRILEEAQLNEVSVLGFHLREMWGDRSHYRADGAWNLKIVYRLFRNHPAHRRFDPRRLHRFWMPLELVGELSKGGRNTGFNLYHLKMISRAGRHARVARYEELDPGHLYQRMGYGYLLDETALELRNIPEDRDFLPLDDPAALGV